MIFAAMCAPHSIVGCDECGALVVRNTELTRTVADQAMITVPLTPPACEALKASSERSGDTDIDTVNQALVAWGARTKRLAIDASTPTPEAYEAAIEEARRRALDMTAVDRVTPAMAEHVRAMVDAAWPLAYRAGRESVDE